jgi:type II secretory pathway component GspD/PulD (secretin)
MNTTKILVTVLFAGLVLQQPVFSQTNAAGTNQTPTVGGATNGEVSAAEVSNAVKVSTSTIVTTVVTNQTVTTTVSNNPSAGTIAGNETTTADATNLQATTDTNNPPAAITDTNATPPETALIRFQDVAITTAIDALARQAGINYLMDPKVGYGQPDANGQIKPEPTLSIRFDNSTPEQALLAVLDNYGLQLVEDPKTKIDKITIKDPAAPPPLFTDVYQLAYASVSTMESAVTTALTDKRSKVVSDIRTSQLIVQATDKEQTDVAALIKKLDKPTRQVLIETRFIEISSNPSTTKGVDWTGTLQNQNVAFGNNSLPTIPGNPAIPSTTVGGITTPGIPATQGIIGGVLGSPAVLGTTTGPFFSPATGFLNADGVKAVVSFLNQSSDAQVVSTPRIVTLDNETANIAVTRAFPIFATTAGTQGSPGGSSVTYSNVGIVLQVTPHISANDYIWMKVLPSVSSFFDTVTKTVGGFVNQADEFDSRSIDTQVLIPNANTLVMGGMVKDSPNAKYTKVPLLGDIPVLGWAFRSEVKTMDKQNLLIFITPTIIKDTDFQPTATTFMQSRPIKEKEPMDPNSAWDSGKPRDWSNPKNTDPTQVIINQKTTD